MIRTAPFLLALFIFVSPLVSAGLALAQESAGIGIEPSTIEPQQMIEPGSAFTETFTVKNLSNADETYYLFVRDISDVTENGRPIFAEDDLPPTGFEMSSWIALDRTEIQVPAGGEQTVNVTITVPFDASPGSHFGSIFASKSAPEQVGFGAGVGYQVANIVSVRVAGDAHEEAFIRSFSSDKFVYGSKQVSFTANVENRGTTLPRPIGPIDITNMFGKKVGQVIMNDNKNAIFPGKSRELTATWDDDTLGFGRYEAKLGLVYGVAGSGQKTISSATTFWILPWAIIKPLLITLFVLFVVSYFIIRRIIRAQVTRLSGGRRLVRRAGGANEPSILILLTVVMLIVTAFALFVLLLLFA